MLRVRLSAADLGKVRFAVSPINQALTHAANARERKRAVAGSPATVSGFGTHESAALVLQLTLHSDRSDPDVEANGNGLVLVPTLVEARRISIKINPRDPIVLVYPIGRSVRLAGSEAQSARPPGHRLRSIVGHSRASIMLTLLTQPHLSTSELALRCGIATSSASEHAMALREAGLILSHRERNRVLHALSTLGVQLARSEA